MKTCIVVPHYEHLEQFTVFLPALAERGLPIYVVDDASASETVAGLARLLDESGAESRLIRHDVNQGKGGAVMSGLRAAHDDGYSHALQIDADGQHDLQMVADFLRAGSEAPDAMICGEPQFDTSISKLRYYARFITLSLSWIESMSTQIRDAMCGFRLYPLHNIVALLDRCNPGTRMAFDPEILVRAVWSGIELHYIPVNVVYPEDGRSHFHYFGDNVEISWMHTRLLFGMLLRSPMLIARKFR